jgi:hypothetical protein
MDHRRLDVVIAQDIAPSTYGHRSVASSWSCFLSMYSRHNLPDPRTSKPARILAWLTRISYIPVVVTIDFDPSTTNTGGVP